MSNKTVKISEKNYDKLQEIKDLQGFKSINQVIDSILPDGTISKTDFHHETPAFNLGNTIVSWNMLKDASINAEFSSDDNVEKATIIFKDDYGVLVRFQLGIDFYIEYYHFL